MCSNTVHICFELHNINFFFMEVIKFWWLKILKLDFCVWRETEEDWELNVQDAILEKCKGIQGILHIFVDANSKEVGILHIFVDANSKEVGILTPKR